MADNTEPKYKVKVPKLNATKRTYSVNLSLTGMIAATGAFVLSLTFFFVMGILIGRGYRPEADVPQLKQIMPTKEAQVAEEKLPPEVLKPEELEYADRLTESPQKVMDEPEPKPEPKVAPKPAPKPVKKEAAKVEKKAEPAKVEAVAPMPPQPGEQVFDYVYQVASFRKLDMAKTLSGKLSASGLKASITSAQAKGSTWHRVQVLYQGTPSSTNDMKAILAKYGIKKPLLKKKTAVQ